MQVDVNGENVGWGVNSKGIIWLKAGPYGHWKRISKGWKHVSVGGAGVWAVRKNGNVYYREGVSSNIPQGRRWKKISGATLNLIFIYIMFLKFCFLELVIN